MMAGAVAGQEITRRIRRQVDEKAETLIRIRQATRVVQELGHLKGAAMKAGQMLALEGRDFLPDEVVQVLEKLQNSVSFMDEAQVKKILQAELGSRYSQLSDLQFPPIAAASIGQVHRARRGDQSLAIKVQYPGIQDGLESDLKVLGRVLKGLVRAMGRQINIEGMLEEFGQIFLQESDYLQEARFLARYRACAEGMEGVLIPQPHPELSTSRILTMDYLPGETLTRWVRDNQPSQEDRTAIGQLILELYTREFCEWGLVQTDPNPGNFLVRPDDRKLILLDFGACKEFAPAFRTQYSRLVMAVVRRHDPELFALSDQLGLIDPRESAETRAALKELLYASMAPITQGIYDFTDEAYLPMVRQLGRKFAFSLKYSPPPRNLIFLHRKLSGVFFMLKTLGVRLELASHLARFEALA